MISFMQSNMAHLAGMRQGVVKNAEKLSCARADFFSFARRCRPQCLRGESHPERLADF
jgi:hypothetical protein